jgi:predicted site-specific integrase-resolvase
MSTQQVMKGYLRKADAAHYLSVSVRTLTDWQRSGLIAHHKPARKVCLYAIADLDRAMCRYRVNAVGEGDK